MDKENVKRKFLFATNKMIYKVIVMHSNIKKFPITSRSTRPCHLSHVRMKHKEENKKSKSVSKIQKNVMVDFVYTIYNFSPNMFVNAKTIIAENCFARFVAVSFPPICRDFARKFVVKVYLISFVG